MIGYDSQRPTDTPEYRHCPDCGESVDWDTMIWLNGRCTCPKCYQRRKAEERISEMEDTQ
ncbi:MAG TPA: hypothetical protein DCG49_00830 [Ruminococcus sp.]|nr:hypothetical protein [Ruminococcus sp.]